MRCTICSSGKISQYTLVEGVPIYRCSACGVAFVDPKTPRKTTTHIYSFADYQAREGQFIARYQKTIELLKPVTTGKKILEVGAGFGLLSSMLCKSGYTVEVLEPDVKPNYLTGLPVKIHKQYLEEFAKSTKQTYDCIILYDVLEHVNDPHEVVTTLSHLLTKNGVVFIQTPNYQSLMAYIVKRWSWWMIEDHRFFFSKKSLSLLFDKKLGKNMYTATYEDWYDFKKNLDGNFTSKLPKALFFAWFVPFYIVFKRILWKLGYGGLHVGIWQYNKS